MKESVRLEREARRIVEERNKGVEGEVARELALALEYLDRCRLLEQEQADRLLEDECSVGTELARLRLIHPVGSPEESQLQSRLLALAAERRRQATIFEEQLATHHRQLLTLVQRYRMLHYED